MVIMIIAVTVSTSVRYVTSNRTSLLKGLNAYLGQSFLGMRNQPPGAYLRRGKPPPRSYLLHASTMEPNRRTTSIDLHTIQGRKDKKTWAHEGHKIIICARYRSLHTSCCNSKPRCRFPPVLIQSFIHLSYCYYDDALYLHVKVVPCVLREMVKP
jgi:hypothetical protein